MTKCAEIKVYIKNIEVNSKGAANFSTIEDIDLKLSAMRPEATCQRMLRYCPGACQNYFTRKELPSGRMLPTPDPCQSIEVTVQTPLGDSSITPYGPILANIRTIRSQNYNNLYY